MDFYLLLCCANKFRKTHHISVDSTVREKTSPWKKWPICSIKSADLEPDPRRWKTITSSERIRRLPKAPRRRWSQAAAGLWGEFSLKVERIGWRDSQDRFFWGKKNGVFYIIRLDVFKDREIVLEMCIGWCVLMIYSTILLCQIGEWCMWSYWLTPNMAGKTKRDRIWIFVTSFLIHSYSWWKKSCTTCYYYTRGHSASLM